MVLRDCEGTDTPNRDETVLFHRITGRKNQRTLWAKKEMKETLIMECTIIHNV